MRRQRRTERGEQDGTPLAARSVAGHTALSASKTSPTQDLASPPTQSRSGSGLHLGPCLVWRSFMHQHPYRKRLRYQGHDYRGPCCAHVTICTQNRQPLFGTVTRDGMNLNDAGKFVDATLLAFNSGTDEIAIDTHIVMPDHVHAVIVLGTNPDVVTEISISDVVQRIKMRVMKSWPNGIRTRGWPPYDTHLWQRSFHDTLIENDRHLKSTREYILANPARWFERMESG